MLLLTILICGLSYEFPLGPLIELWLFESLHAHIRSQNLHFICVLLSILGREQVLDAFLVVVFLALKLTQS